MPSIEEHIQQALREGKFADLPGKGKPLNLQENPFADPDWRLAHHMLQSSGYTLPWIEARQEIEASLQAARQALRRAREWRAAALEAGQDAARVEAEWQRLRGAFERTLAELNQRIRQHNLQVPSDHFQLLPLSYEKELAALTRPDP
jgi:DnaJ family protein C protein 28